MPETGNGSETSPLAGSTRDTMLVKELILVGLLIVLIVGPAMGLYVYLIRAGPTAVVTHEPISSTTIEPITSAVTEPLPFTTPSTASSTKTTKPPATTAPGIFIATPDHLIALNLLTLEATKITTKGAFAVAVNDNLKKVYWSEGGSVIMRSSFDGSSPETLPTWQGDSVYMLAIDETSGNIYYGQASSDQIVMCNSVGTFCSVIIHQSAAVFNPVTIAVDSANSVLYLSGYDPPSSFISADMKGGNTKTIDGGFFGIRGIALEKNSNDVLYWIDKGRNTIGTIHVDGFEKRTLIHDSTLYASHIQVDAHMIYFVTSNGIQSANKLGEELTLLLNISVAVNGLALFNVPVQQS